MPARLGRSLRVTSDERITAPGSRRVWRPGLRFVLTRADTIFGSRVLRTFLNGVPGTGEQRSLARTAGKLLRHALLAAMAATIAAGVWLLFEAMDSITVVVFIVAAGVLLTVLLRRAVLPVVLGVFYLAWTLGVLCVQTVRIPASITIDGDTIHVGRRRFELARLREISLTPPSYLPHARRFTLRTSRGRRLRWNLGTSEPGMISEARTDATARVSTRLV